MLPTHSCFPSTLNSFHAFALPRNPHHCHAPPPPPSSSSLARFSASNSSSPSQTLCLCDIFYVFWIIRYLSSSTVVEAPLPTTCSLGYRYWINHYQLHAFKSCHMHSRIDTQRNVWSQIEMVG
ncbi:hypothetical protein BDQ17DRAFT_1427757 [Cyathus striatus]|nr:hypothetical protein BDQ17DRAFT_1427757 [Cyathus striatus]